MYCHRIWYDYLFFIVWHKMNKVDSFLNIVGALNDETRILILNFLSANGETCVCDLQNMLDMKQSRLSRHLKILKDSGFLYVNRKGAWAYYGINNHLTPFHQQAVQAIEELDLRSLPPF